MRINFKNTSYDFSFKSEKQMPLFMISKEYYVNGELDFAKILFEIKGRDCRKKIKKFINSTKEIYRIIDEDMSSLKEERFVIDTVTTLDKAKEISANITIKYFSRTA